MSIFFRVFSKVFAFFCAISAFFILLGLLLSFLSKNQENRIFVITKGNENSTNKIAVIKLSGPILEELPLYMDIGLLNNINVIYLKQIREILNNLELEKINGLIVSINSPGGSVSASYSLYNIFRDFSIKNSIDIFFHTNELMASGAYWVALSSKKIYANYGSLIGSIGVKGPDWIYFDMPVSISNGIFGNSIETKKGIIQDLPTREDITIPIEEQLIVELYSR